MLNAGWNSWENCGGTLRFRWLNEIAVLNVLGHVDFSGRINKT